MPQDAITLDSTLNGADAKARKAFIPELPKSVGFTIVSFGPQYLLIIRIVATVLVGSNEVDRIT